MDIKSDTELVDRYKVYKEQVDLVNGIKERYGGDYASYPKIPTLFTESLCGRLIQCGKIPLRFPFEPNNITLHGGKSKGGKNHNDLLIGNKNISVKATAGKGKFTWFGKHDFTANANIWLDFYESVHEGKPTIQVTVFYNLGKHLSKNKAKITYTALTKTYPKKDVVVVPPIDFLKVIEPLSRSNQSQSN